MTEDALRNPFVVFCNKCNRILTDSFTLNDYKGSHLIHSFSTVKEASRIEIGKDTFENCLVQQLSCECGNILGVFLASAGGDFNGHAGCYAFNRESVKTYMLGSAVSRERSLAEVLEDVEKLKSVVAKIYKRVYQ